MSILKQVKEEINRFEAGKLITYSDFSTPQDKFLSLAKALSTLCKQGLVTRVSKGVYYKPEYFPFGASLPTDSEIIETFLTKNKVKIAYVTGINAYNQLGLTTQVSKEIVLATDKTRCSIKVQNTEIRFIRSKFTQNIKKSFDIPLLQMLDAITDIKSIPDSNVNTSCSILFQRFKQLNKTKIKRLSELVFYYPPSTRALTGAFFELLGEKKDLLELIQKSLNKLTTFKLGITTSTLPNKYNWNIR